MASSVFVLTEFDCTKSYLHSVFFLASCNYLRVKLETPASSQLTSNLHHLLMHFVT